VLELNWQDLQLELLQYTAIYGGQVLCLAAAQNKQHVHVY
jgi:hypothetical protein